MKAKEKFKNVGNNGLNGLAVSFFLRPSIPFVN